jgi:GDP-4-dehydro-6-deoxy-D-mannose reductase
VSADATTARPMRALVVGANGFVGRWLIPHLRERGDVVDAIVGPHYRDDLEGVRQVHRADVRAYDEVAAAVAEAQPEAVYYLAAISEAGSRERVEDATRIGLVGAIHALTACAALDHRVRLLYVSSAHLYGGGDEPLTEESRVAPTSVYGAVKAAAERALLELAPLLGLEAIVARPFNHIGPGQADGFLVPALAARIRAVAAGEATVIKTGSLDAIRDFTDVRDVVAAYRILVERGEAGGIYNVASGEGTSVAELLNRMLEIAGVSATIETDPALVRIGERRMMVGDASRLGALGWSRSRTLDETLGEILRGAVQSGS